jgi:DNA-directed RNA polymerase subunit RPC12/RpoP
MQMKLTRWFTNSAGALLLGAALAMFMANWTRAGLIQPYDPIFMISVRNLFWIMGSIALGVAWICLFAKRMWLKVTLVLWFVMNLFIYELSLLQQENYHGLGVYLGSISNTFGISPGVASLILKIGVFYLLVGGSLTLLWLWREDAKGYLKVACARCGGHITFLPNALGQQIPCPHCRATITLYKPDESLKMTCVLCGGHVEFPAHSLGQKIPCPHCAKTITLLKPA